MKLKNNNSNVKNKINVKHMIKSTVCYLTNPYQLILKMKLLMIKILKVGLFYVKLLFQLFPQVLRLRLMLARNL